MVCCNCSWGVFTGSDPPAPYTLTHTLKYTSYFFLLCFFNMTDPYMQYKLSICAFISLPSPPCPPCTLHDLWDSRLFNSYLYLYYLEDFSNQIVLEWINEWPVIQQLHPLCSNMQKNSVKYQYPKDVLDLSRPFFFF